VGSHRRRGLRQLWHGSTSQELLRAATLSVLCVPAERWPSRSSAPPRVRRVLVPTDLSELGNRAIPYAYSSLPEGGVVHLLHIAQDAHELTHHASITGRLLALVPSEAEELGIETRVEVLPHSPVGETIYQAAERNGVDLICMSSHGYSGLHGALTSSIAQELMGRSRRPLLVIRAPASS
jgi:nucleotide-binding universal stress UspA family protein